MKVIIAGGRDFNNYELMKQKIDELDLNITEIVSGGARGADALGQRYALEHNIPLKIMNAEWDKYGRAAGIFRNKLMGDYADYLIAFWDGRSHGTKHMIHYMEQKDKHGSVFRYTQT